MFNFEFKIKEHYTLFGILPYEKQFIIFNRACRFIGFYSV